ncbi:hypothetical protein CDAR_174001 [Caerostris darwini]|uniref:Uncharacterized protein n=1 Tax=Caerostris darwini TaxID=1538125 RepID=A0AAV4TX06_9ARAC|nr:hypothetical protein CDAR_174001 [Caerostris darwini]
MATHPRVVFVVVFVIISCCSCDVISNSLDDNEMSNDLESISYTHVLYPRDQFLEDFKADFLQKLNLPEAPVVEEVVNVSSEVVDLLMEKHDDRFQARSIVRPHNSE